MKNIRVFYLKNFGFLEVKFSIYLNRRVFVMSRTVADPSFLLMNVLLCGATCKVTTTV